MNYKKTKRNKYKKTKRNKYKTKRNKYNIKRRKYKTKRRKYNKRGGADAAAAAAAESIPTETEFPDPVPLDCSEIKGKTLYVSKSLNDDDDHDKKYDLIYVMNDFENGKWVPGPYQEVSLQPIILISAPTKINLLLKSLGIYIPVDPDFNVKELIEYVREETVPEGDFVEEDITGKVLFEVTPEFIQSKKSELFIERLKYCKTCVIGAGPGYGYSGLNDFYRWSSHDPYFIGFSNMDPLLVEPFTGDWLKDTDIFRRGFEICKPHLPNNKFEHIFIDKGTIQHLDEGGIDAFTPLIQAIISTNISDRLCIDDIYFRRMFEDLLNEDIPKMEYYRIPKPGGGFYKSETGADVKKADLGISEMDIEKPENKINTLAEWKSDPKILIKVPELSYYFIAAEWRLIDIDYTDKGELILRHFNRTEEIIEIDKEGNSIVKTFHVFTKRT